MTPIKVVPLNAHEIGAADWIQIYWHQKGLFPTKKEFEKNNPLCELETLLKHPTFQLALANRGIDHRPDGNLTAEQSAAIIAVCNYADRRSQTTKLRALGIGPEKWKGWLRNKKFKDFLHSMAASDFHDSLNIAYAGLMRAVEKGNVDAIKFYLELTGRYTPTSVNEQNTKVVVSRLIESIQRHVKDPLALQRIVSDFVAVSGEETPALIELRENEFREIEQ